MALISPSYRCAQRAACSAQHTHTKSLTESRSQRVAETERAAPARLPRAPAGRPAGRAGVPPPRRPRRPARDPGSGPGRRGAWWGWVRSWGWGGAAATRPNQGPRGGSEAGDGSRYLLYGAYSAYIECAHICAQGYALRVCARAWCAELVRADWPFAGLRLTLLSPSFTTHVTPG